MNHKFLGRAVLWTLWSLAPVAAAAYYFGPGQTLVSQRNADKLLEKAEGMTKSAQASQDAAYATHIELVTLRNKLHEAGEIDTLSLEDKATLAKATEAEKLAYANAGEQWRSIATVLGEAESILQTSSPELARKVRVDKAQAMIRGGLVNTGIEELEDQLQSMQDAGISDPYVTQRTREELATGYYYNARLLRMAGQADEVWKQEAAAARQQFRYLAENAADSSVSQAHQQNVEHALNLMQSSLGELHAKPMPKNQPGSRATGDKEGKGKGKGKRPGKGPPQDSRGGGANDEIGPGW